MKIVSSQKLTYCKKCIFAILFIINYNICAIFNKDSNFLHYKLTVAIYLNKYLYPNGDGTNLEALSPEKLWISV